MAHAASQRAQAHTGVLHELAGNVPVIPVQVFDVGRGKIEEFGGGKTPSQEMSSHLRVDCRAEK